VPDVKICGLTNAADARAAVEAGARYVGVVFAGGARALTVAQARVVLDDEGHSVQRVGVIGTQSLDEIGAIAREAALDIVQLHADPDLRAVTEVRDRTRCAVWAVVRIQDDELPRRYDALAEESDAVVLDSYSHVQLGGTGRALQWSLLASSIAGRPRPRRLVLAGGLHPDNVSDAVDALHPDVLDVSSGVEQAIGHKDHELVRAFIRAARGGSR
jgi:phosphoribosylanthranilate isomerase